MGKSFNQKLKLLYIMQMLKENTDENHAMSANDIISALAKQGISAERKMTLNGLNYSVAIF